jgi:hypothetical protein
MPLNVPWQAGMYPEAAKAAVRVSNPDMSKHVNLLLVVNAYEQDDLPGKLTNRLLDMFGSYLLLCESCNLTWTSIFSENSP